MIQINVKLPVLYIQLLLIIAHLNVS